MCIKTGKEVKLRIADATKIGYTILHGSNDSH